MNKESLTVENLLSWQEILNFAEENQGFNCDILKKLYLRKSQVDQIVPNIESYFNQRMIESLPNFPFDENYFNYRLEIKMDKNGKKNLVIDKNTLFQQIIYQTTDQYIKPEYMQRIFSIPDDQLKEVVIKELKKNIEILNANLYNDYACGYNVDSKTKISKEDYKNAILAKRKMARWITKNYDQFYEYLDQPLPPEIVLKDISKDRFLLFIVSYSLNQSNLLKTGYILVNLDNLNYVNDYALLVDYLNSENGVPYTCNFHSHLKDGSSFLITSDAIIQQFRNFCKEHHDKIKDYAFATSYEEVLKKNALATWKRIQSEKHAKNIRLNFEMIQSGKKITLANYQKGSYQKITSTKEERQLKLKQAYDLLEEKMEYFAGTNFQMELIGIDTFAGYTAYIYANGVVVLEKLYKRITKDKENKDVIVPATEEAIYVMNYTEFAELSKYSKPELIQEISLFQNPNVARILHTQNGSWKDKVTKWITGNGYGEFDYEIFDQLIGNLKEENKTLKK